jgi:hypothetical protein
MIQKASPRIAKKRIVAGIADWRNNWQHLCEPHLAQELCQQIK